MKNATQKQAATDAVAMKLRGETWNDKLFHEKRRFGRAKRRSARKTASYDGLGRAITSAA
jgi:hypothetical protein